MVLSMLRIYGSADERTVLQMQNCLEVEEDAIGVLCADNHLGYSQPIGAAIAYRDHVSPSGVGYDIGCGNLAVRTNLTWADIREDMPSLMDEITARLSFGVGRRSRKRIDHPVIGEIRQAEFKPQQKMADLAADQLGTIGAGNHYVDVFVDTNTDSVWVGAHFGSRGFGHKTATGFMHLAAGEPFDTEGSAEGEIMSPPIVFHKDSGLGQSYIRAMEMAGRYAYAGRDVVCEEVLDILGAKEVDRVHNHHNFAWQEDHHGETFWVVRKGCTPAFPGQRGFVGSTMAENSVILEGTEMASEALFSTVHGAGRAMSRTKSGGKWKWRRACRCGWVQPKGAHVKDNLCPDCGRRAEKRRIQVKAGEIDWQSVKADMSSKGIVLKGAAPDEAPDAYKRLERVLSAMGDTIRIERELRPVGVAMAGPDVNDPYKD